jgi:Zn-dependent oligopeptidase
MEKSIFGNTPSDIQQFDQQLTAINKVTAEFAKVKTVEDLNRINRQLASVIANLSKLQTTNVINNT